MNSKTSKEWNKITDVDQLAHTLGSLKAEGRKIVLCHGVFDLLHIGHIRHFGQAKKLGDVLVVTLTPDCYVNKGPSRPAFGEDLRAEAIAALDCVDYVAINRWPTAVEAIQLLGPHYYVKGSEYSKDSNDRTGGIIREKEAVLSVGGQLAFTDDLTFSASNLINRRMSPFSKEVSDWLSDFSDRYSSDDVLKHLDSVRSLKVLAIGETIIDEYVYCESIGKSGKEPVLATRQVGSEKFAGGIVAVANHISAISDSVTLLTFLGKTHSQEDFIRQKLNPNVEDIFLRMDGDAPTIIKRRFVESYPFQKLFELYVMDDGENKPVETETLCNKLAEVLPKYDAVLVTDYGHGMLAPQAVELLCSQARFLAVNTQANAGNQGFNTVSKYRRADFICVAENEIRLEARSRRKDLREIVLDTAERLSCDQIIITRGPHGCLCYSKDEGFTEVPAVALNVVDRIGAGDAVFSVAGLCAAQRVPSELTGFIGNVAGAEAVATVGNRSALERVPFVRHIETLLK
jgi:rfaE bifunctional protein kinase chain/domain/rfaE bifunctional protein nucleotidyltransferase chain/domain